MYSTPEDVPADITIHVDFNLLADWRVLLSVLFIFCIGLLVGGSSVHFFVRRSCSTADPPAGEGTKAMDMDNHSHPTQTQAYAVGTAFGNEI